MDSVQTRARAPRVVAAEVPRRARERVQAERRAAQAPATVKVQQMTPESAKQAGRYRVPTQWPFSLVLKVAPVLADFESAEAGLVLANQPLVVPHETQRGSNSMIYTRPTTVVTVWGADSTFEQMTEDDWRFVANVGRALPVPAFVTSHLRSLAYYSAVDLPRNEHGLEGLQRWERAVQAVEAQVGTLELAYGKRRGLPDNPAVLDMTGEQVMRHASAELAGQWCQHARAIATSSRRALRTATDAFVHALAQGEPKATPTSHFYVASNGSIHQNVAMGGA